MPRSLHEAFDGRCSDQSLCRPPITTRVLFAETLILRAFGGFMVVITTEDNSR